MSIIFDSDDMPECSCGGKGYSFFFNGPCVHFRIFYVACDECGMEWRFSL